MCIRHFRSFGSAVAFCTPIIFKFNYLFFVTAAAHLFRPQILRKPISIYYYFTFLWRNTLHSALSRYIFLFGIPISGPTWSSSPRCILFYSYFFYVFNFHLRRRDIYGSSNVCRASNHQSAHRTQQDERRRQCAACIHQKSIANLQEKQ